METSLQEKVGKLAKCIGATRDERIASYAKWMGYWNYIAKNHAVGTDFSDPFSKQVVKMLGEEGVVNKASHVLDIGCGSGAYTLEFARIGQEVTAVDLSEEMLSVLRHRMDIEEVPNIICTQTMFEHLPEEKQYDLVFASMCPAICDFESLQKMERFSKKYCCLITVAKGSQSQLRHNLRNCLTTERLKGLSPDVIYQFDLLYEWERYPNIRFYHFHANPVMTLKQAIKAYTIYYEIFGFDQPQHQKIIASYLEEISQNGVCIDQVTYHLAVLWWQVPES